MNQPPDTAATHDAQERERRPFVHVDGLCLEYRTGTFGSGRVQALRDLTFEIPPGSLWALVGANGSGKSSLIRCALGFRTPTKGSVRVFGEAPTTKNLRARVGVVLDGRLPLERLTGREYLTLTLAMAGFDRHAARERADEVLARLGLADASRRAHGTWSTGMERRLAFAEAIARQVPLLVLDEPGSGLDPLALQTLRNELEAHRARGGAALVATHVLDGLGADLFDRILVLHRGRAVQIGTPDVVLQNPLDRGKQLRLAEALARYEDR
ncbi:MAG: ABC transporter ATP-binding protein [Planctomycetes bacterium]|nr:ABC transporter ATP-binding protein [Planctomycetota bacterium]